MKEIKLIVFGGRDFEDYSLMESVIDNLSNTIYKDSAISIVTGMAKGADSLGYIFALKNNVVNYKFPADWNKHGRQAGYLRNIQMGEFSDAGVAFWDGKSMGTLHMIKYLEHLNKPVHIVYY